VCVFPATFQGIYAAVQALVEPGDEAVLIEAAYDIYAPFVEVAPLPRMLLARARVARAVCQ
jgi:aspartate/methionine/tyrosine aminotransferase